MVLKRVEIAWETASSWVIDGFFESMTMLVYVAFYVVAIAAIACCVGWVVFFASIPWLLLRYFAGA